MKETILPETRFGLLTTKELTKNKEGKKAWRCLCDCGNEKIVRDTDLKSGKVKTCGYQCPLRYTISGRAIDETGKVYGRLTVIKRIPPQKGDKRVFWECKCSCGNYKNVSAKDLRSGKTTSCSCLKSKRASELQFKDETNNRYGKLTVVSLGQKHPKAIWKCLCDCGKYKKVKGIDLRSGNTKSCGCLLSWPEEEISKILEEINVIYQRQYSFNDLFSQKGNPLRFDFAILKDNSVIGLIEYNGEQHYKSIDFYGGESGLKKQQERDRFKEEYCKTKNIPLLILNKKNKNLKEDIIMFLKNSVFGELWEELDG